jgi:hypothetical protein
MVTVVETMLSPAGTAKVLGTAAFPPSLACTVKEKLPVAPIGLAALAVSCTEFEAVDVAKPQAVLMPTKFNGGLPALMHHR